MRGATGVYPVKCHTCDFNPRTPRGVRRGAYTHTVWFSPYFNPRAPCGARRGLYFKQGNITGFQSTHPSRGATFCVILMGYAVLFQSTRPMRGATQTAPEPGSRQRISIHAPRAGRDSRYSADSGCAGVFQSTRPVRGATHGAARKSA